MEEHGATGHATAAEAREPATCVAAVCVKVAYPQVRADQHLVIPRVGPGEQQPVRPEDERVVLADVKGGARVAEDLLELVLVLALVHVLLRRQVGRDLLRQNQVHLRGVRVCARVCASCV